MLYSPERHETVIASAWDEHRARAMIQSIVRGTEESFAADTLWPTHPKDDQDPAANFMLYCGACGVFWALRYLKEVGAVELHRDYSPYVRALLEPNRLAMEQTGNAAFGAYLMGDTSIHMLDYWDHPSVATEVELQRLIRATMEDPTRELMWGAPGTLLAARLMHQRTGGSDWAGLYRDTARKLWSQLEWSEAHSCHYWTQDMYGQRSTYLDAVHGFVATAFALIQGRHLLEPDEWDQWQQCITNTISKTAEHDGPLVNWRAQLSTKAGSPKLVQFCHGAPGFIICLADFPDVSLDHLLLAGGDLTWRAGPLVKGSNLCHGTGGNGYAFLKLYRRFGDPKWLERARAFAMHGIAQTEDDLATYGHLRHSLWTGDPGFAIYLWECIQGSDRFPTLDTFFAD